MRTTCVALAVSLAGAASDTCEVSSKVDCGAVGTDATTCLADGCCWDAIDPNPNNYPWCFQKESSPTPSPPSPSPSPSGSCEVTTKSDCGSTIGSDQSHCEAGGCCWKEVNPNPNNEPWCYHSSDSPTPTPPTPPSPTPPTPTPPTPTPPTPPSPPSPSPAPDPSNPVGASSAFVHLFEWSWADIADECEQFLAPKGFTAVQISPPNDHISGDAWWTRYQPVTYELVSRSGDEEAFIDMVGRCKKVGVGIYADAVINHIAASSGTSIAGKSYGNRATPIYSQNDMHHTDGNTGSNCQISDYSNKWNVQYCDLEGLPDLCTSCDYVQTTISGYLNNMEQIGIAGFRIDAAKHQDAGELGSLLSKVNSKLWKFGEVISGSGEAVTPSMYYSIMDVTEFAYSRDLAPNFVDEGKLQFLNNFGESWGLMPTDSAVVFIDNHDTQRGEAKLTYKNGDSYQLANIFMLAHPYGYPKVMSSYYFDGHDQGPPKSAVHKEGSSVECGNGKPWVCEHRWTPIANMVNWRKSAGTNLVSDFQAVGPSTIAFCRGGSACVAMNRGSSTWSATVKFSMPAGEYCNVIQSDDVSSCPKVTVSADGQASISVPANSAVAVHVGKQLVKIVV